MGRVRPKRGSHWGEDDASPKPDSMAQAVRRAGRAPRVGTVRPPEVAFREGLYGRRSPGQHGPRSPRTPMWYRGHLGRPLCGNGRRSPWISGRLAARPDASGMRQLHDHLSGGTPPVHPRPLWAHLSARIDATPSPAGPAIKSASKRATHFCVPGLKSPRRVIAETSCGFVNCLLGLRFAALNGFGRSANLGVDSMLALWNLFGAAGEFWEMAIRWPRWSAELGNREARR
jgi:hypothetical protein